MGSNELSEMFPPAQTIAAEPGISADKRRDPADLTRAETVDADHGRIETRRIRVRTKLPLRLDKKWRDIKAICRIERIRETKTKCSREVVYALPQRATRDLRRRGIIEGVSRPLGDRELRVPRPRRDIPRGRLAHSHRRGTASHGDAPIKRARAHPPHRPEANRRPPRLRRKTKSRPQATHGLMN